MDANTRAALITLLLDLLKQLIAELLAALRELRDHAQVPAVGET